jgi:hypothetical protein
MAIEKAILGLKPSRSIAKQYGVTSSAVLRHNPHITKAITKAAEKRVEVRADNLLAQLLELVTKAREIGESALAVGKHNSGIAAIRTMNDLLANVARLTGQLDERNQVNIAIQNNIAQDKDELTRLRRLTPDEREQLRGLLAKMESPGDVVEVEAVPMPEDHNETVAATSGPLGE